jgi:hypothetical protein
MANITERKRQVRLQTYTYLILYQQKHLHQIVDLAESILSVPASLQERIYHFQKIALPFIDINAITKKVKTGAHCT